MRLGKNLLSASIILSLTILAGRVVGFLREAQLGAIFGLSSDADIAVILLTTPDLMVNLILAGGLSAALIPEFRLLDRAGRGTLFLQSSAITALVFGLLGAIIWLAPSALLALFAPAYVGKAPDSFAWAARLTALTIPLAALSGITTALLNSRSHFFIAGAGTLVFNITIVAGLYFSAERESYLSLLALLILLGASLRYASQLASTVPHVAIGVSETLRTPLRALGGHFLTALSAASLVLLVPVMLRSFISLTGNGHIAAFNFASKLVELPTGIAITTIGAVAFPLLAEHHSKGNLAEVNALYTSGVQRAVMVGTAIAIPCIWFSDALVGLAFGHGRISPDDIQLIAWLAQIGFLTLPAIAVSSMATALLNSRRQGAVLFRKTLLCMAMLPLVALPAIASGDVRLAMAGLPIFHFAYAAALSQAAGIPLRGHAGMMQNTFVRRVVIGVFGALPFILVDYFVPNLSEVIRVTMALSAAGISLLFMGALPVRLSWRRWW